MRAMCLLRASRYVAEAMTQYENHKTTKEHNSALFSKLALVYFMNNYSSLFYIAFVKGGVEGCFDPVSGSEYCGRELAIQVIGRRTNERPARGLHEGAWVNPCRH